MLTLGLSSEQWLTLLWVAIPLLILMWYYLFFFTSLFKKHELPVSTDQTSGVSVLVSAKNEAENLKELIPLLLDQNYDNFEILVINDGSWDASHQYLQEMAQKHSHLRSIYIDPEKKLNSGKKLALTLGIKAAQYDYLLFTDADCRPNSKDWIKWMMSKAKPHTSVLGYSPYMEKPGFLNWLIRLETQMTAFLYLGAAGRGFAYMSVGRNWLYTKEAFFKVKGFAPHQHIYAGDDDLQVQNLRKHGVKLSIMPEESAFVSSKPKTEWKDWIMQKRRHKQIGKFYGLKQKLYVGLFSITHLLFWLCWIIGVVMNQMLLPWFLGVLAFKLVFFWSMGFFLAKRLRDTSTMWFQPFNEFILMIYWLMIGVYVFFSNKKEW